MMEMFDGEESESAYGVDDVIFRPIISEADRRRRAHLEELEKIIVHAPAIVNIGNIYDTLLSGKVKGVKLVFTDE